MKTAIKILSSLILIPIALIALIAGTLKFQILNDKFWINSFENHDIYSQIQKEVFIYLEGKNATIISDLATLPNIKDFVDKNISHTISFLNGNYKELTFYIPVEKIPKELLPKKLGTMTTQMTAKELIQKFNIGGIDPIVFDQFKVTGKIVNYVFYISIILFILLTLLSYPVSLTFFGIPIIFQSFFIKSINFETNKVIDLMLNPVIVDISKSWSFIGILLVIISIIIFSIRKVYKK